MYIAWRMGSLQVATGWLTIVWQCTVRASAAARMANTAASQDGQQCMRSCSESKHHDQGSSKSMCKIGKLELTAGA